MKKFDKSKKLFAEAQRYLPGGVDSPVRAFKAVGGTPPFIAKGKGSRIYDVDGNDFLDYVCSWGPLILGHAYPPVIAAVQKAAELGTSYGAPTELETILAKMVSSAMPSIEMVRFVSSGTEATMSALRLARGFTKRDKIIKFAGGYHGHADGLLIKAGSGVATLGIPDSPGVPESYAMNTLTASYNDLDAVKQLFKAYPKQIAAVIVEPVAANMGVVLPAVGFLEGLRDLTRKSGALLIFDEVISGFRLAYGGAQAVYNVTPDLTCLGKIIGGGLPVGAYGGRRDIMSLMAPLGPVYQAGTLSGNPLAVTAGIETLKALKQPGVYKKLEKKAATLEDGIIQAAAKADVSICISRSGSLLTAFFTSAPVVDYDSAKKSDTALYAKFFWKMIEEGIYWPPSQFEAAFVSLAHSDEEIKTTIDAITRSLKSLKG
jgi:glutamate-1-semialdehyde 2,1-aminomutase